jgi:hypothetical protein
MGEAMSLQRGLWNVSVLSDKASWRERKSSPHSRSELCGDARCTLARGHGHPTTTTASPKLASAPHGSSSRLHPVYRTRWATGVDQRTLARGTAFDPWRRMDPGRLRNHLAQSNRPTSRAHGSFEQHLIGQLSVAGHRRSWQNARRSAAFFLQSWEQGSRRPGAIRESEGRRAYGVLDQGAIGCRCRRCVTYGPRTRETASR